MNRALCLVLVVVAVGGCAASGAVGHPSLQPITAASTTGGSNLATTKTARALPFIDDDYGRALDEARRLGKPLFVDTWAMWCHTCRFMRAYVLTDPRLAQVAGRFVWLAIDIDRDENQAYLAKFPTPAVPTMLIIDPGAKPGDEAVLVTRSSSASYEELLTLLDEGEHKGQASSVSAADRAFAEGQRLVGAGDQGRAIEPFERALKAAPADWPRRRRALESLIFAESVSGGHAAQCAERALSEVGPWPRDGLFASVVTTGLSCALELPKSDPTRADLVRKLSSWDAELLGVEGLLGDDRSSVYETLVEARDDAGDAAGKHRLALEWTTFLEKEASAAKSADARAVYDPHRVNAALALGDPGRVLPALLASAREMPDDYNPPARLAVVYLALGQLDDAMKASNIALTRVYGPRKLRVLDTRAQIFAREGDASGQRGAVEQALAVAEGLPASPRREATVQRLTKERDALK